MNDILVVKITDGAADLRQRVYNETLDFLVDNIDSAQLYEYLGFSDFVTFVKKHSFSTIVFTNVIGVDVAYLLKGMGKVQIMMGFDPELNDVVDIVIDPLSRRSDRHLVGPRYVLPKIVEEYPIEELADILGMPSDLLRESVRHNEAETTLLSIVKLCEKLEWDSNFFGVNVGYISCLRLTPNIQRHIAKFIQTQHIDMLEYCCNCHDRESVIVSERNGYSFVDIRMTFERSLHDVHQVVAQDGYFVKKGIEADIPAIRKIATDSYKLSRYHFDTHFNQDKVREFYVNWAEKAIRGTFDDFAYVLYDRDKPIGFCSIKKIRTNAVSFGLVGLSADYRGSGLAKYLLDNVLVLLQKDTMQYVEVVTQGRNYAAQRLYQKCGFVTKSTELWYHKWFR